MVFHLCSLFKRPTINYFEVVKVIVWGDLGSLVRLLVGSGRGIGPALLVGSALPVFPFFGRLVLQKNRVGIISASVASRSLATFTIA